MSLAQQLAPTLRKLALAVLLWTVIGLVFALPSLAAGGAWQRSLLGSFAQWWSWGLLTPVILAVDRRLPFNSSQLARRVIAHLVLSTVFTAGYLYLYAAILALLRLSPWSRVADTQLLLNAIRGMFLWSVLVYCLIVGIHQALLYHQRYLSGELRMQRLERSFSEARLNALRMQLDPHFLFNTLNTISSQVEREPRLARQMIEHLGDLLRSSLENKDRQEITLTEELAFLDHYLAIQKIRFGDRLRFTTDIAPEVKYALVPCLVIQPLVENAIRHGLASRATGGTVQLSARNHQGQLELRIADDGIGLPANWSLETSTGLGLSVTRERIRGLHPHGAGDLELKRRASGGTEAIILLPLRFGEAATSPQVLHDSAAD